MRRSCSALLMLFVVSIIVFAATQALRRPRAGDPRPAGDARGIKALREQLHLNDSVFAAVLDLAAGLLHGDAGTSLAAQEPVSTLINDRIVNSAFLVFCAAVISIPLRDRARRLRRGRRDRGFDNASSLVTLLFAALPEFVIGLWLIVLFATTVFHGTSPRSP